MLIIPSQWFLPAHTSLEILSVFFSFIVFLLGWSAYTPDRPRNMIFLSCSFLSVGLLDFLHTMSYEGMPLFVTSNNTHKAIVFWLAARLVATFTLLIVVLLSWKRFQHSHSRYYSLFASLSLCVLLAWVGLFRADWIPKTYIVGYGLTPFKIGMEVAILVVLLFIMAILLTGFRIIEGIHKWSLIIAICFMILSGPCFIFYNHITDLMNFVGHLLKAIAYYFIYQAILKDSVHVPYAKLVQTDKELIETREKFAATIHCMQEAVIISGVSGQIELINPSAQRITQWSEAEALGKKSEMVVQVAKPDGETDLILTTRQGIRVPIEFSTSPIIDDNGYHLGITYMIRDITEQIESGKIQARMNAILEQATNFISITNSRGEILYCNEAARNILGIESQRPLYSTAVQAYPEWAWDLVLNQAVPTAVQDGLWHGETVLLDKNGKQFPVSQTIVTHKNRDGQVEFFSTISHDITEHKQAEQRDKLSAKLFESASEGFMITDAQHIILQVNPAFVTITGYEEDEVLGNTPRILSSGWHKQEFYAGMWKSIQETSRWSGQIWNKHKNGEYYLEEITISEVNDQTSDYAYYVAVFKDITEEKQLEAKLFHQASHDILTDLPNRSTLSERFEQAMQYVQHHKLIICVLYLNIDNLKLINETFGHSVGDQLLKSIAEQLKFNARASSTVARIGGDEFVILLPDLRHQEDYMRVADKTCEVMSVPFDIVSPPIDVAFSIGICFYPDHGDTLDALIKNANHAMQKAKQIGPNQYQLFHTT
ncbi:MAG: MASE3 domain-containing protein [Paenibacillaceae bacterium]